MQIEHEESGYLQRPATPANLIGMIRMLDVDKQVRILINNPEALGGCITYVPRDGIPGNELEMVILNTEENKIKALDFRYKLLSSECKDLMGLFVRLNKPYQLSILNLASFIYDFNGEYERILREAWTNTEFPHQARLDELIRMFERADRNKLMNEDEKESLERLPDRITIYRGYSETLVRKKKTKRRGLSWTLDKVKARWFAERWNYHDAKVAAATISKSFVYMYTDKRNEKEVVVNPRHLKNVKVTELN